MKQTKNKEQTMIKRILISILCLNISASISCMHTLLRRSKPSQPVASRLVNQHLIPQRSLIYAMWHARNEKWERSDALDHMAASAKPVAFPQFQTQLPWFASNKNRLYFAKLTHFAHDLIGGFYMDSYVAFDNKEDVKQFKLKQKHQYLELLCHGDMSIDTDKLNKFSIRKTQLKTPKYRFLHDVCAVKLYCYKGPKTVLTVINVNE